MQFNGIEASQLIQSCEGGSLIVQGDSPNKVQHYERALELLPDAHILGVNRGCAGLCAPDIFVTMHCDSGTLGKHLLPLTLIGEATYVVGRACNGDQAACVHEVVDGDEIWGTSALLGVLVGLWLGYDRLVLSGVELTGPYGSERKLDSWKAWAPYWDGRVTCIGGTLVERGILQEAV